MFIYLASQFVAVVISISNSKQKRALFLCNKFNYIHWMHHLCHVRSENQSLYLVT